MKKIALFVLTSLLTASQVFAQDSASPSVQTGDVIYEDNNVFVSASSNVELRRLEFAVNTRRSMNSARAVQLEDGRYYLQVNVGCGYRVEYQAIGTTPDRQRVVGETRHFESPRCPGEGPVTRATLETFGVSSPGTISGMGRQSETFGGPK